MKAFGITSEDDDTSRATSAQADEGNGRERRRIRFEDPQKTVDEKASVDETEQEQSRVRDNIAEKSNREFRLRFGLKRTKAQVDSSQAPAKVGETKEELSSPVEPVEQVSIERTFDVNIHTLMVRYMTPSFSRFSLIWSA